MRMLTRDNNRFGRRTGRASVVALGGILAVSMVLAVPSDAMAAKKNQKQDWVTSLLSSIFKPSPPPQNGGGSLPNGKPFQELANRIDRLRAQVSQQNAEIESLAEDLGAAELAIADLETIVSNKCEEIAALQSDVADLRAKDEELMAAIENAGGLTQEELIGLLSDPLFLQTAFLTEEFAMIHDMLNADLAGEVAALSAIIDPVADCLLDIETCVLDIIAP